MINEECAKTYCCEDLSLIENYDKAIADTTQTWECHHILGEQYCSQYLKENCLYENRPACEFRFMTKSDHRSLHTKGVPKGPLSEAHKKALSEAHKGIPRSEATKKAIGDGQRGVPKVKLSKKILQFTKSGEFIREWPSMNEASRQLKINCGSIWSCCKGKLKSAGGYIWEYA